MRCILVCWNLVVLPGSFLAAQAELSSSIGRQVRWQTDSSPQWVTGTLVAADDDSVRLRLGDQSAPLAVARRTIGRLEVRYPGRPHPRQGAAIGFGFGALVGAIVGYGSYHTCTGSCTFDPGPGLSTLAGALGGGAIGLAVGAAIGTIARGGGWRPVSLGPTHATVTPHGAGLALSLAF